MNHLLGVFVTTKTSGWSEIRNHGEYGTPVEENCSYCETPSPRELTGLAKCELESCFFVSFEFGIRQTKIILLFRILEKLKLRRFYRASVE